MGARGVVLCAQERPGRAFGAHVNKTFMYPIILCADFRVGSFAWHFCTFFFVTHDTQYITSYLRLAGRIDSNAAAAHGAGHCFAGAGGTGYWT